MKSFLWLLAFLTGTGTDSLRIENDHVMVHAIRTEATDSSQVMNLAFWMSEAFGPRLTNSTGYIKTSQWAVDKLRQFGFNSRLEAYGEFGRGWDLKSFRMTMTAPYSMPLIAYPKAWSPGASAKGAVVYVGRDSLGEVRRKWEGKLKGRIVLVGGPTETVKSFKAFATRYADSVLTEFANDKGDREAGPRTRSGDWRKAYTEYLKLLTWLNGQKPAAIVEGRDLQAKGAHGTIFVQGASRPLTVNEDPFSDENPRVWAAKSPLLTPQILVSTEHYNTMARLCDAGIPVEIDFQLSVNFVDKDLQGYNVIADWEGTDKKDEIVMAGAHLDSWQAATGATDNGVNCATVIEAVRILKKLGVQPRRTIRIALWTGEEQGLLGSRGYVKNHFGTRTEPTADHAKLSVYFNLDNGVGQIRGINTQKNADAVPIFQQWFEPFKDWSASTVSLRTVGSTDHQSFDEAGLPGFQFIQDPLDYFARTHHSNMDNLDRVMAEDVQRNAAILAHFLYMAAQSDELFPRKKE